MNPPKLPASFSLFRQRGPKGFDFPTRYYDAEREEREERLKKARERSGSEGLLEADRAMFADRMRHSWQRQTTERSHITRLLMTMGGVMVILYFIIKGFGLVQF
jgi:hypothetical protein